MSGNQSALFGGGTPPKWVSGTFSEGYVAWSPTDYQYYMNKTTGVRATDPASDPTNWQATGERAVKSVQRGLASPTATSITISAVVMAKTRVFANGYAKDGSGIVQAVLSGYLTATTTISMNGNAGFTGGGGMYWEAIETY